MTSPESSCHNSLKQNITVIFTGGKALRRQLSTTPTTQLPFQAETNKVINSLSPRQRDLSKPRVTSHGRSLVLGMSVKARKLTCQRVIVDNRIESLRLWVCKRMEATLLLVALFLRQHLKIPRGWEALSWRTSQTFAFCLKPKMKIRQCWMLRS